MKVTVLGATGKTGGAAAERLLAAGVEVRAVARSADKLAGLAKKGAQPVAADLTDAAALAGALRGSDAAYLMIPSDYTKPDLLGQYARAGESIARAVRDAGLRRAALLSSLGADAASGTGPIAGLHGIEEALKAVPGLNLLILRPGYFYENSYGTLGLIKHQGINGGAIAPDVPIPSIAAADIGVAAAQALRSGDFSGTVVRELSGPRDLTMAEATRILGKAIGKPDLAYVHFPDDGYVEGLKSAGFAPDAARLFLEMAQAFNKGVVRPRPGVEKLHTPTTFESFADAFAQAYRAAA
ncbi:MAG TPA: NAD(P)H-binding protein [Polyangia bacterium]|nr:NAD(P)H-binding protein [Polyangia bacterium]